MSHAVRWSESKTDELVDSATGEVREFFAFFLGGAMAKLPKYAEVVFR